LSFRPASIFTRADAPQNYALIQGEDPQAVFIRRGYCIVDPSGNMLVEPDFTGETVRVAKIDRRVIADALDHRAFKVWARSPT
jgi:nitrilase